MIARSRKFPLRTNFLSFRRNARASSSLYWTVYSLPSPRSARMAVVVSKKVNHSAAVRNWLKRLTYDALWPRLERLNLDLVVVYKPLKLTRCPATEKLLLSEIRNLKL